MDDPFRILGLPRRFDLTPADIAAAHRRVIARLHPDRASNAVEREAFVRDAAAAGAAKDRLSSDIFRAEELLELLGARPLLGAPLPPAFLAETLELREAIEEACLPGAASARASLAAAIAERCLREREAAAAAFAEALAGPPAEADASSLRAAAEAVVRLKYLERMRIRLDPGA